MNSTSLEAIELVVYSAIATVDDPEYPGISIADLGLLERIAVQNGKAEIGLIPTFSGCPALSVIAEDVVEAVSEVEGVTSVDVTWLRSPVWSVDRVSSEAKNMLADDFTVAVQIGGAAPTCPRCGSETEERSLFGPSRCRGVHRCPSCF